MRTVSKVVPFLTLCDHLQVPGGPTPPPPSTSGGDGESPQPEAAATQPTSSTGESSAVAAPSHDSGDGTRPKEEACKGMSYFYNLKIQKSSSYTVMINSVVILNLNLMLIGAMGSHVSISSCTM